MICCVTFVLALWRRRCDEQVCWYRPTATLQCARSVTRINSGVPATQTCALLCLCVPLVDGRMKRGSPPCVVMPLNPIRAQPGAGGLRHRPQSVVAEALPHNIATFNLTPQLAQYLVASYLYIAT